MSSRDAGKLFELNSLSEQPVESTNYELIKFTNSETQKDAVLCHSIEQQCQNTCKLKMCDSSTQTENFVIIEHCYAIRFHKHLQNCIICLPRDTIKRTMHTSFKNSYPKTTCIIDCTEMFIPRPFLKQELKHTIAIKVTTQQT